MKNPILPIDLPPHGGRHTFPKGSLPLGFFSVTNRFPEDGELTVYYPGYEETEKVEVVDRERVRGEDGRFRSEDVTVKVTEDNYYEVSERVCIEAGAEAEAVLIKTTPVRIVNSGDTPLVLGRN